jgi:CheY-like chemotaxis protein
MNGVDTAERSVDILMADDDPEDQMLVRDAFTAADMGESLSVVNDGEELLEYLGRRGRYTGAKRPDLLLLDLNMPRKDGREVLSEIKADPDLRTIPVVVLTTSSAEEDILRSYNLSSYIQKPVTFDKLVAIVKTLAEYWCHVVELPPRG